jgi:hypothetical protein
MSPDPGSSGVVRLIPADLAMQINSLVYNIAIYVPDGDIAFGPEGDLYLGNSNGINQISVAPLSSARYCSAPITTTAGSVSGNFYTSMPETGMAYKKFVCALSNVTDAGTVITYPAVFNYLPAMLNGTSLSGITFTTSAITIPASAAVTGTITLEGM